MIDGDSGDGNGAGESDTQGTVPTSHRPTIGGADIEGEGIIGMLVGKVGQPPPPLKVPMPGETVGVRFRCQRRHDSSTGIPRCKIRQPDTIQIDMSNQIRLQIVEPALQCFRDVIVDMQFAQGCAC